MVRNLAGMVGSVTRRSREEPDDTPDRDSCLVCEADLTTSEVYSHYRVCPRCRFHYSMSARERITSLADPESFEEINRSIVSLDPLSFSSRESYTRRLFRDQRRTGLTEAVVTGTCTISGSPVMLIVLDFGFMGGTMGCPERFASTAPWIATVAGPGKRAGFCSSDMVPRYKGSTRDAEPVG